MAERRPKKGKPEQAPAAPAASVAAHPRAQPHVTSARGWGGLAGFGLAAAMSWSAGIPLADVLLRALVGGVAGFLLAWYGAVTVWSHLVVAEIRAAHREAEEAAEHAARARGGVAEDAPAVR
jgi:hypothetical protein